MLSSRRALVHPLIILLKSIETHAKYMIFMIKRETELLPKSQVPATNRKSVPSAQTKLSVPKANSTYSLVFDATRILHRYREMRDNQH
jgi:hypothetical protein